MKSIEQPLHSQMVELVEIEFRGEVNARANALSDMHGARKMVRSATVIKEQTAIPSSHAKRVGATSVH